MSLSEHSKTRLTRWFICSFLLHQVFVPTWGSWPYFGPNVRKNAPNKASRSNIESFSTTSRHNGYTRVFCFFFSFQNVCVFMCMCVRFYPLFHTALSCVHNCALCSNSTTQHQVLLYCSASLFWRLSPFAKTIPEFAETKLELVRLTVRLLSIFASVKFIRSRTMWSW